MPGKKRKSGPANYAKRLVYEQDEKKHTWLTMLLKAYAVTDAGIDLAVKSMETRGFRLACAKGCAACCVTHRSIPVYPLELVGITWYATEKLADPVRAGLKKQLLDHQKGDPCAFLVDNACAIHPLRPMACRQFNVFSQRCVEGEDAYYTRRQDVLTPLEKYSRQAFIMMLPFYGVIKMAERRKVARKGLHHTMAKDMQTMNWDSLSTKMEIFDRRHSSP